MAFDRKATGEIEAFADGVDDDTAFATGYNHD
jgi:hypothetical protein